MDWGRLAWVFHRWRGGIWARVSADLANVTGGGNGGLGRGVRFATDLGSFCFCAAPGPSTRTEGRSCRSRRRTFCGIKLSGDATQRPWPDIESSLHWRVGFRRAFCVRWDNLQTSVWRPTMYRHRPLDGGPECRCADDDPQCRRRQSRYFRPIPNFSPAEVELLYSDDQRVILRICVASRMTSWSAHELDSATVV